MATSQDYIKLPVNKALFYFRDGFNFEWEVFRIFNSRNGLESGSYNFEMPDVLKGKLSNVMIAMKHFPYVSGMISNGGCFYLYESYLEWKTLPCIAGLYELGEYDTIQILLYTYADYQLHNEERLAQDRDTFLQLSPADKIQKLHAFLAKNVVNFEEMATDFRVVEYEYDEFERMFWCSYRQTMQNIVEHIKANVNDYVTDEDGNPFDLNFTGVYCNPNDVRDYELPMLNGKPHGRFKIYNIQEEIREYSGEFEHGFLENYEYTYIFDDKSFKKSRFDYERYKDTVLQVETKYYQNSNQPEELSRRYKYKSGVIVGEQKTWYENGQVKDSSVYEDDRKISSVSYFEDGSLWYTSEINEQGLKIGASWFANGNKSSKNYVDEKGLYQENEWTKEGTLIASIKYDEYGQYIGHHKFYATGERESVIFKQDGEKDRLMSFWDKKGNQTVKNGNGYAKQFSRADNNIVYSEYKDGLRHGVEQVFDEKGNLCYERKFENGFHAYK